MMIKREDDRGRAGEEVVGGSGRGWLERGMLFKLAHDNETD